MSRSARPMPMAAAGWRAVAYGPRPGVVPPPGAVIVGPGDSVPSKISQAGPGGALWFLAGVHDYGDQHDPLDGQVLAGEYGAIIDGGRETPVAMGGEAQGVTVTNLVFQNFDPAHDIAAVHCYDGIGWLFDHCRFTANTKAGLHVTYGATVRFCRVDNNGQAGLMCRGEEDDIYATGIWIHHNEIDHNNPLNAEDGDWDAGGMKIFGTDGVVVERNWAHHNVGPGLWLDINHKNALVQDNLCEDNASHDIFYEISYGTTVIRRNICLRTGTGTFGVRGGGTGAPVNPDPAAIFVSNSEGVEVYGNFIEDGHDGIIGVNVARGEPGPTAHVLGDLHVHDNTITGVSNFAAGIRGEDVPLSRLNIDFQNNTYADVPTKGWVWGDAGGRNISEWQALGHDV